ncbi:hypothetical protein ERJ75_000558300 [Trypanosoma vivax]|nr:hypothetical protein ERJ75_000558300 [Trypanosoma vivax]
MPSPRASGAPQFDVPCEGGSRASLEAKKRAAAPETMNSAADMVLDSAAEERRQHCNQARPVARPEAKREAASNSGSSSAQLRQASASAGKRSASTQAAEGVRKRRWHHKSDGPRPAPPIFGVASGQSCHFKASHSYRHFCPTDRRAQRREALAHRAGGQPQSAEVTCKNKTDARLAGVNGCAFLP